MGRVAIHHNHPDNLLHKPMKSRRRLKFNPNSANPPSKPSNFAVSDYRKQTPPNRIPKKRDTASVATKPPAVTVAKNLVVGQVKILKRGETLKECSTNLNKAENDKNMSSCSYPKTEALKTDDLAVYSTRRLGPDPKMMSKQMKNVTEYFAGSVFFDSPPPSSVPLPGFVSTVKINDACSNL